MKILILILSITSLVACSQHTVRKTQELSRDYTTIQFSASNKPYQAKEEVGGEQINSTTIKTKANEAYLVEVTADNDSLNFNIDGKSLHVEIIDNNPFKRKITAYAQTNIELSFTAHPDSSLYEIIITKL